MARRPYSPRRLVVGDVAYLWSVSRPVRGREAVRIRRAGARHDLLIVFRARDGRFVDEALMHSGEVHVAGARSTNLHEPGVVRALLDAVLAGGWDGVSAREVDGWPLLDSE